MFLFNLNESLKININQNWLVIKSKTNKVIKHKKTSTLYLIKNDKFYLLNKNIKNKIFLLHTLQKLFDGLKNSYSLKLNLVGLGFKINVLENNVIELKLGFSHSIYYELPEHVSVIQPKDRVSIYLLVGPELSKLTQVFATLRRLKKPEPYKGKGIRYFNEIIKLKEGKKNNG